MQFRKSKPSTAEQARAQIEARDLELIKKAAEELDSEIEDILQYQSIAIQEPNLLPTKP